MPSRPVRALPRFTRSPATVRGGIGYTTGESVKDERGVSINRERSGNARGAESRGRVPCVIQTSIPIASPSYVDAQTGTGLLYEELRRQSLQDGFSYWDEEEFQEWAKEYIEDHSLPDDYGENRPALDLDRIKATIEDVAKNDAAVWEACSRGARRAAEIETAIMEGPESKRWRRMTHSK